MVTDAEVLATRCQALEERVRKLENYGSITIGLAIILGLGGSWIGTRLSNTQARLDQIQSDSAKLVSSLQEAKANAIENINKTGKETASILTGQIKAETQAQVASILNTSLAERVRGNRP